MDALKASKGTGLWIETRFETPPKQRWPKSQTIPKNSATF
jgi:hypothetical protein